MFKRKPQKCVEEIKPENPWERAYDKLHTDTISGGIQWRVKPTYDTIDDVDGPIYSTTVLGHTIAIYRYKYKDYYTGSHFTWETDFTIQFVRNGECVCPWPLVRNATSLYWAVASQVSGANEFLTKYLAD